MRVMRSYTWFALPALVLACGPEAPHNSSVSASSTDDAGQTGAQGTSSTAMTSSLPTTGNATGTEGSDDATSITNTTTDVGTTDASSGTESSTNTDAGTTDASAGTQSSSGATTDLPGFCMPETDWNEEHVDCLSDWPTSTKLEAKGPAAPLGTVTQMLFGVLNQACIEGLSLEPIPIGDPLMPKAVLYGTVADCGPEQWPGVYDLEGVLADDTHFFTTMTIDGYAGDWLSADPLDPPRFFGSFSGDLVGAFEAIHCAAIDVVINNCG